MATNTAIEIEQSTNIDDIKHVLSASSVFPRMSDDFTLPIKEWDALRADAKAFIAYHREMPVGTWLFVPDNAICWRAHFAVLPEMYGEPAFRASQEVIKAAWREGCLRIVGEIPEYNRLSLRFVQRLGFSIFGVNSQSCMKHGVLWDQVMVGLSKARAN